MNDTRHETSKEETTSSNLSSSVAKYTERSDTHEHADVGSSTVSQDGNMQLSVAKYPDRSAENDKVQRPENMFHVHLKA